MKKKMVLNLVKLVTLPLLFVILSIPAWLQLYSECLLSRQTTINLTPSHYPAITISLPLPARVPHISSITLEGALYGLGYIHSRDRLWQMELKRLVAYGKLSSLFGGEVLFMDKYFRTLGLEDVCRRNLEWVRERDQETYWNLVAYSEGVNQEVKERGWKVPVEFLILGVKWREWTPLDCLMLTKFAFVNLIVDW